MGDFLSLNDLIKDESAPIGIREIPAMMIMLATNVSVDLESEVRNVECIIFETSSQFGSVSFSSKGITKLKF